MDRCVLFWFVVWLLAKFFINKQNYGIWILCYRFSIASNLLTDLRCNVFNVEARKRSDKTSIYYDQVGFSCQVIEYTNAKNAHFVHILWNFDPSSVAFSLVCCSPIDALKLWHFSYSMYTFINCLFYLVDEVLWGKQVGICNMVETASVLFWILMLQKSKFWFWFLNS
jgi:hypothetical protein